MRKLFCSFFILCFFIFNGGVAQACESCSCALSRSGAGHSDKGRGIFFDVTFEQMRFRPRAGLDAHNLHHEGHHVHNKTHEELTHFMTGFDPREDVTLLAEIPYVHRRLLEVDSHRFAGQNQTSEGWGDMKLQGIWRFWRDHGDFLGALGGVKLPTGSTSELNPQGVRFEGEAQPGTGSTDGMAGGVFQKEWGVLRFHGNVVYSFRPKGDYDFQLGDLFSSYIILDVPVGPSARLGLDSNLQYEKRHIQDDIANPDSGGTTWLLGPSLTLKMNQNVSVLANVLFPVVQELGGVHQTQLVTWNASVRVRW